jgi:hypothetical protein
MTNQSTGQSFRVPVIFTLGFDSLSSMKAIVSIKDVVNEMDGLSDEHSAFLNRHTGELVTLSMDELSIAEENDNIAGYPEWQQDMIIKAKEVISSDDYLPLPSKFEIHEYHIIEEFCCSVVDDKVRGYLLDKIKGRGDFSRFKNSIHRNGIEDEWYRFRQEKLEKIAIDWLEVNQISYTKDI